MLSTDLRIRYACLLREGNGNALGDGDRARLADWLEVTAKREEWEMQEMLNSMKELSGRTQKKEQRQGVKMIVVGKGNKAVVLPSPPGGGKVELGENGEANVELDMTIRGRTLPDDVVAWLKDKEVRNWLGENGVTTVNIFADWEEVQ